MRCGKKGTVLGKSAAKHSPFCLAGWRVGSLEKQLLCPILSEEGLASPAQIISKHGAGGC